MSYPDVPIDPDANVLDSLACWMGDWQLAAILLIGLGNLPWNFKKVGPWVFLSVGILGVEAYMLYYKYVQKGCQQPQTQTQ